MTVLVDRPSLKLADRHPLKTQRGHELRARRLLAPFIDAGIVNADGTRITDPLVAASFTSQDEKAAA
jgi:hypothetical protein